jgi:hypothetical protein
MDILEPIVEREFITRLNSANREHTATLFATNDPFLESTVGFARVVDEAHASTDACGINHSVAAHLKHIDVGLAFVELHERAVSAPCPDTMQM